MGPVQGVPSAPPTTRPTTPSAAQQLLEARRNVARLQQQLPPADRVADVPSSYNTTDFSVPSPRSPRLIRFDRIEIAKYKTYKTYKNHEIF